MIRNQYLLYLMLISLLALLSGCKFVEYFQQDPFYRNGSEWDHLRFPLIKPYYAIYQSEKYGWQVPLQGAPSSRDFYYYTTLQDIQNIAVEYGAIMIFTPYEQPVEENVGQKVMHWFVFLPVQNIEKGFEKEEDFIAYVKQLGITKPAWKHPDDILKEYDETWCLDWIPTCN